MILMHRNRCAVALEERAEPHIVRRHGAVFDWKAGVDALLADRGDDFLQAFRPSRARHGIFHLVETHRTRAGEYLMAPAHPPASRHQLREQPVRGPEQKRRYGSTSLMAAKARSSALLRSPRARISSSGRGSGAGSSVSFRLLHTARSA